MRQAWAMIMRQLNAKVGKTGTLFKDAAAEGAKHFSRHAFTALSPEAQDAHSWTCDVCPKSERARRVFGTAVLKENARGAARADPPLPVSDAPVWAVPCRAVPRLRTLYILRVTLCIIKSLRATQLCKTHLYRWRRISCEREAARRGWRTSSGEVRNQRGRKRHSGVARPGRSRRPAARHPGRPADAGQDLN